MVVVTSQEIFVCKMELRDAVCKQFQSREILRHAESILREYLSIYIFLNRLTNSAGKRLFFVETMAVLGEYYSRLAWFRYR